MDDIATLLKGAPVASAICEHVRYEVTQLAARNVFPQLAIVRVGDKSDDIAYETAATKRCNAVGVAIKLVTLPENTSQDALVGVIDWLNKEDSIHGVLLLRPLPKHIDEATICTQLLPAKDVDGITPSSLAGVFMDSATGFPPCTAAACIALLDHYALPIVGKRVVVVGRSLVIGKPVAALLLNRHATVTICHTRTADLPQTCQSAEMLVVAAGKAGMIDDTYLSPQQVVLDVGIHVAADGSLCGDVSHKSADITAITPVPGGIGGVTTAILAKHVVTAAKQLTT